MAITSIVGLANGNRIAVFGNVQVEVTTNNASAVMIKIEVKEGSTVLSTEFAPVFVVGAARKAYFNLRSTLSSIMFDSANIVTAAEAGAPSAIAAQLSQHHKAVSVVVSEYTTEAVNPTTLTGIILYKAVDVKGALWGNDSDFIAFEPNDCERTAFKGEYLYPIMYRSKAGNPTLNVDETVSIEATPVNGMAAFRVTAEKSVGVYDDWYLPSIEEMQAMRNNLHLHGVPHTM
jgi:hypothetical protein